MKLKKKLVIKALTDPQFRKLLAEKPEEALTKEELEEIKGGIGEIFSTLEFINSLATNGATMIFCMPVKDVDGPWYA